MAGVPINPFKQALKDGRRQIGLWQAMANPYTAEICAGAGFDWLLFDGEHAPNDIPTLLAQLQAVEPYPVHAVGRPPYGEIRLIKQYLDIGFQTLLIPLVDTPEQAAQMVRAMRYPPMACAGSAPGPPASPAGTGWRTTSATPTSRCACWSRPRPGWRSPTSTPSAPPRGWTACSSAPPTSPPPSAIAAIRLTRRCKPPSRRPSPPS